MSAPAVKATPCVTPVPSGSVTPPTPSPAPSPEPHDACWNAAQKLLALGCKDSRGRVLGGPDLSGLTWSQVCRQDLANGVNLNASCITAAATCATAEACK